MASRSGFDNGAFYAALDAQRRARNLAWKQVAAEAGVSASTLTRIAQGRRPDVDSLAALTSWSGLSADSFIHRSETELGSSPEPLAAVSTLFHSDPNLTPEGAVALDQLVQSTYERLRRPR
jgi:transcriptional regulator with XRE-family HTH domain